MFRSEKHEASACAADLRAGEQQTDVVRLRMLATLVQAVRDAFQADLLATVAMIDTLLHSGIHLTSHAFLLRVEVLEENTSAHGRGGWTRRLETMSLRSDQIRSGGFRSADPGGSCGPKWRPVVESGVAEGFLEDVKRKAIGWSGRESSCRSANVVTVAVS